MMVEQEVLDSLADEAPSEPEKVHVVARLSSLSSWAAGVISGAGAGAARIPALSRARTSAFENMMTANTKTGNDG
jgi:hypothetical protein